MKPLETIFGMARSCPSHIALGEGEDPRVVEGAVRAARDGIAQVTLIGDAGRIRAALGAGGADAARVAIADPATSPRAEAYAAEYRNLGRHRGVDDAEAARCMKDPLCFAAMMVRLGDADGTLSGAATTTADTVRAALRIIGAASKGTTVSSFFLMMLCEPHHPKKGAFVFADCGLVIEPSSSELADIAISSAQSFEVLTGETPRVAMLSFSTNGSASHERVTKVVDATAIVKRAAPSLLVEGEIQFDAAFIESVGASKAPLSKIRGDANVFVFPNLDAANIGYKIAQRIGGAKAIGPILQGLAKPANDLSRGCSADDVYHMIAVTAAQAAHARRSAAHTRLEKQQAS